MTGTKEMVLQTPAPFERIGWSSTEGVLTMNTTKTLMLAAVAALSLGLGTAMAQSESNGNSGVPYWTLARQADALRQAEARNDARVQYGSSDVGTAKSGLGHVLPFGGDFGDLANPG